MSPVIFKMLATIEKVVIKVASKCRISPIFREFSGTFLETYVYYVQR